MLIYSAILGSVYFCSAMQDALSSQSVNCSEEHCFLAASGSSSAVAGTWSALFHLCNLSDLIFLSTLFVDSILAIGLWKIAGLRDGGTHAVFV